MDKKYTKLLLKTYQTHFKK